MIIVDSNDATQSPDTVDALRAFFGRDQISIGSLREGDLSITLDTGVLLIERKRPHDLLASIGDGRLFEQAQRMSNNATFAMIVIQGYLGYNSDDKALADGRATNWHGPSVRAALRSVQWAGVGVEQCAQGEFAKTVSELITLAGKADHTHLPPRERLRPPPINFFGDNDAARRLRLNILSSFPGIGAKRAESLLKWVEGNKYPLHIPDELFWQEWAAANAGKGRLAIALEWASSLGVVPRAQWPDGWGPSNVKAFREALDLSPHEFLSVQALQVYRIDVPDADGGSDPYVDGTDKVLGTPPAVESPAEPIIDTPAPIQDNKEAVNTVPQAQQLTMLSEKESVNDEPQNALAQPQARTSNRGRRKSAKQA